MIHPKQNVPDGFASEPFQALATSGAQAAKAFAPMMKWTACVNLELTSLAGRRAKAYLDIPNVMAQCRGPQDLFAAQARFWQAMMRDYADYTQRVMTAAQSFDGEAAPRAEERRERDTLVFPGLFGFPAWPPPEEAPYPRGEKDRAA